MDKKMTVDIDEYERKDNTIYNLRNKIEDLTKYIYKLETDIKFLKEEGDGILVIVKDKNSVDTHEYKTKEKNVISDLILENKNIIDKYNEMNFRNRALIVEKYELINNNKKEMDKKEEEINKLKNYIKFLEKRNLIDRIANVKKEI